MRVNRLSRLGSLLLAGTMLTGCGTFLGSSGGSAATKSDSAKAAVLSSVTSTKAAGQESSQPSTVQVSDTNVGSGSSYPSFGLDVTGPEVLALNERLAELGYLPVQIANAQAPRIIQQNLNEPPQVTFVWRYQNVPPELRAQWNPNRYTQMTRAAVIAVERANGLSIDGITGPNVWKAILAAHAVPNPHPYTFVLVEKSREPETLRVWQSGKWVYQSIANTGIPQMTTTNGTYAVYLRFVSQTMTGVNPDGTHYSDKGVPYVNYFNGSQAIHGFVRANYGFPQSLGCVELPVQNAKAVWSLLHYGTLVSIIGHYTPSQTVANASSSNAVSGASSNQGQTKKGKGSSTNQETKNNQGSSNSGTTKNQASSNPGVTNNQDTGTGQGSTGNQGKVQTNGGSQVNGHSTSNNAASSVSSNQSVNSTSFSNTTPTVNTTGSSTTTPSNTTGH